eukprot:TRINITY_DN24708_c0_g1_i1.p1 TRINITY_DN24708_c0_g1~~TRINITY_DN24708_c0_g1_i1.p1  ORF type:complete len:393 (-),score=48.19 TRINITY_DN24708_c0_g1_i1:126-1274(-)
MAFKGGPAQITWLSNGIEDGQDSGRLSIILNYLFVDGKRVATPTGSITLKSQVTEPKLQDGTSVALFFPNNVHCLVKMQDVLTACDFQEHCRSVFHKIPMDLRFVQQRNISPDRGRSRQAWRESLQHEVGFVQDATEAGTGHSQTDVSSSLTSSLVPVTAPDTVDAGRAGVGTSSVASRIAAIRARVQQRLQQLPRELDRSRSQARSRSPSRDGFGQYDPRMPFSWRPRGPHLPRASFESTDSLVFNAGRRWQVFEEEIEEDEEEEDDQEYDDEEEDEDDEEGGGQGLSPAEIEACTNTVIAGSTATSFQSCVVCLEDYAPGQTLRFLRCCHRYHKTCIDTWLSSNRYCPECKIDVLDGPTGDPIEIQDDDLTGNRTSAGGG